MFESITPYVMKKLQVTIELQLRSPSGNRCYVMQVFLCFLRELIRII